MVLSDLWRTRANPPAVLTEALAELDRLGAARAELSRAAAQLGRVLEAAFTTPPVVTTPAVDSASLAASWRDGVVAFRVAPAALDVADVRLRGMAICDALRADNRAAGPLREALRRGHVDLVSWWTEWLAGRPETIEVEAHARTLDSALAASVLRLALLPALAAYSEALGRDRPAGVWDRGECPHCGGSPALAESRGLEQRRHLRCGLCAADWPVDRVRCAFCGESDHRALGQQYVEGEQDRYRLVRCDSCGSRIKVVSTLSPLSAPGLLVAELATVHLDLIADQGIAGG